MLQYHGDFWQLFGWLVMYGNVGGCKISQAVRACRGSKAGMLCLLAPRFWLLCCAVQDAKLVDTACLALTRIAEAFSRSPEQLELLCSFGLITSITQMVRNDFVIFLGRVECVKFCDVLAWHEVAPVRLCLFPSII